MRSARPAHLEKKEGSKAEKNRWIGLYRWNLQPFRAMTDIVGFPITSKYIAMANGIAEVETCKKCMLGYTLSFGTSSAKVTPKRCTRWQCLNWSQLCINPEGRGGQGQAVQPEMKVIKASFKRATFRFSISFLLYHFDQCKCIGDARSANLTATTFFLA